MGDEAKEMDTTYSDNDENGDHSSYKMKLEDESTYGTSGDVRKGTPIKFQLVFREPLKVPDGLQVRLRSSTTINKAFRCKANKQNKLHRIGSNKTKTKSITNKRRNLNRIIITKRNKT